MYYDLCVFSARRIARTATRIRMASCGADLPALWTPATSRARCQTATDGWGIPLGSVRRATLASLRRRFRCMMYERVDARCDV